MKYIVFDTETTGLDRRVVPVNQPCSLQEYGDEVIQIGGTVLDHNMEVVKIFCYGCDCLRAAPSKTSAAVHGIDMQEQRQTVRDAHLGEIFYRYLAEFFYEDVTFVGYNVEFDLRMVQQSLRNFPYPFHEPLRVTRALPKRGRNYVDVMYYWTPSRKLVSFEKSLHGDYRGFLNTELYRVGLCSNIMCEEDIVNTGAHNALYDAILTYLLFKKEIVGKKLFGGGR